ncbi:LacI family DNA-binding transcriptional regulator [Bifidobacterium saguinibicoloris]|uniref:LacI family DNA-binding transcriptional regulator n=1 Tax=Bifidobacterium saguinibicoloris TaxID=2834433 RepID=UPI001C59AEFC|nr:LacI family DNA-binding transcriptional regulator [Bifidobacterium saguinibicoloris]MBW3081621.1 LacI family DNA-binding transcriptional regulator [Bifidobacterium saguinibicoloris]
MTAASVPEQRPQRATMADVAAAAGVTKTTVSRYLNKHGYVSKTTANRIAKAMKDLDFTPNRMARSLARQHTNIIIYVIHGDLMSVALDPGLNTHYAAAGAELARHGYQILSMTVNDDIAIRQLQRMLDEGFADGYLFSPNHDDDPILSLFAGSNVPMVTAGDWAMNAPSIRAVNSDNHTAMRTLTEHMLHRGHRRILYISGPTDNSFSQDRIGGFLETMHAADAESHVLHAAGWRAEDGLALWPQVEPLLSGIDAVIATNDVMAAGLIQRIQSTGFAVPGDIAVAGFDNTAIASANSPSITTIDQHLDRHGTVMADTLLSLIEGNPPADGTIYVPTELVVRESA